MHNKTENTLTENLQHLKKNKETAVIPFVPTKAIDNSDKKLTQDKQTNEAGGESTDIDNSTTETSLSTVKVKRTRRVKKKKEVDQLRDCDDGDETRRVTKRVTRAATKNVKV